MEAPRTSRTWNGLSGEANPSEPDFKLASFQNATASPGGLRTVTRGRCTGCQVQTLAPSFFLLPTPAPTARWRWGAGLCVNLGHLPGRGGLEPHHPPPLPVLWVGAHFLSSQKMTSPLFICPRYRLMNQSMGWGQTEPWSINPPVNGMWVQVPC